jgi:S1-C subfamily serine protease
MQDDNNHLPEQPQEPSAVPADAAPAPDHPAHTHSPASYVAPAEQPFVAVATAPVERPLTGHDAAAADATASVYSGPVHIPLGGSAPDVTAPYPAAAVAAVESQYVAPSAYVSTPAPAAPAAPARGHSIAAVIAAGVVGGLLGALILGAAMWALLSSGYGLPRSVTVTKGASANTQVINPKSIVEPAVAVARKVLPSVVNVTIYQAGAFGGGTQAVGNGSGVVYKPGGYIITNNHVVTGADKITVRVGVKEVAATVVGTDPKTDIAVIKVNQDLPTITVGDSSTLEVGQTVVAVGSPFGLDKTVTMGIVSALGRQEFGGDSQGQGASTAITAYTNLIQTDASINPGNSGGALVDAEGRLVGINTLIAAPAAQQSAGVGFAIPEATAVSVADQLIKSGKVDHPFVGLRTATLTPDIVAQMGKNAPSEGAVVEDVVANSPAAKAGIQRGDVIVTLAGQPVKDAEGFVLAVRSQKVGDTVPVEIWRNGAKSTLQVTVGSDQATQ